MSFQERTYRALIACSLQQVTDVFEKVLPPLNVTDITVAESAAAARSLLSENEYDLAIVVSPLPDEFGKRFAKEMRSMYPCEILLVVPADHFDEVFSSVMEQGIMVVSRPMSPPMRIQSIRTLCTMRERMRSAESKRATLEDKMAEIRTVNHAKWLLITNLSMSEEDAHHYIEKQAMNQRVTKRELAEGIIAQYE